MEAMFSHEVVFSNRDRILVSDVAHSLLANEQIILNIGSILEKCFDGLTIEKINIEFRSATVNSPLKEALAAGILFTFQDTLKKEVPAMIEKISGQHIDEKYATVVTVIFLIIVIYGIEKAWDIFKNSKKGEAKQPIPHQIITNYGTLVQAGGDMLGIPSAQLASAISRTFPPKRVPQLARTALAFIQPAKREKGAFITGAGFSIDAATIEAAPSELDIAMDDDEETQTPLEKAEVAIHATDIDHNSSGWAGHLPGLWEKRLRMKLFPSIPPAELFGKEKITADIILVAKRQSDGGYIPYMIHVLRVYD